MKRSPMPPRKKPLARSPMKRGTAPMKRTRRLQPRSKKMRAKYAGPDGRAAFVEETLAKRPRCEAGVAIGTLPTMPVLFNDRDRGYRSALCDVASVDVHEILARSAGGSILDPAHVLAVCRACHDWIGDHPREALALGLRRSRYPGRNP